jgi:hypothetical protein
MYEPDLKRISQDEIGSFFTVEAVLGIGIIHPLPL